ncbi:hypothetical protein [Leptolyngbya sp. FACHB-16]|uniref:hypothetical protein n=1 Tax=unclassified Leptolyngbya TaxID=2650499 RepID=UPI0016831D08|nr:hypothetical protein [Leptolyngbya sp. FACHB-16]
MLSSIPPTSEVISTRPSLKPSTNARLPLGSLTQSPTLNGCARSSLPHLVACLRLLMVGSGAVGLDERSSPIELS